jgi:hypothetical protein
MKVKLAVLIILFMFFMFFNSTHAWTLVNQSGSWVAVDRSHWLKVGWNEGYAEWNHSLTSFQGYYLNVTTTTWENYREWWQIGFLGIGRTINDFWIKIKIDTNESDIWVVTQMHGHTAWFGVDNSFSLCIGASTNAQDWKDVKVRGIGFESGFDSYDWSIKYWNPDDFEIFILNENGKIKVKWFIAIPNQLSKFLASREFDGTLGSNAVVTLIYEHAGQGKVEGFAQDSFTLPPYPLYETKGPGSGWWDWFNQITWGLDWGTIISTLFVCVTLFFGFVRASLPILGAIVVFWIVDCISTAVIEGEPRVIGEMAMKIYDFLRGVWQILVNIFNAIMEIIKFWG